MRSFAFQMLHPDTFFVLYTDANIMIIIITFVELWSFAETMRLSASNCIKAVAQSVLEACSSQSFSQQ